jgi:hypothetical protein
MATTLVQGDVAIVHYVSDNPDTFAFVFLRDIEAGTTVNFTDNGWLAAGGFRSGEGTATYTAPTDITAGTVITVPIGTMELNVDGDLGINIDIGTNPMTHYLKFGLLEGRSTLADGVWG